MYTTVFSMLFSVAFVNATLTGSTVCNQYMCVAGEHDDTTRIDTYTLSPPSGKSIPQSSFGWIAIGFGTTMAHTPMVIAWPNSDGSFTLSQRQASDEVMPTVVSNPPRQATLLSSSSFANSTSTQITFALPASTTDSSILNATSLIWAYSKVNPKSSSVSATIVQHDSSGEMTIALLAPLSSSGGSTSPVIIDNGNSDSTPDHNWLVAHAVIGGLGAMVFIPIGVTIPRISRSLSGRRWWFPVHASVQGVIALILVLAAWAIAAKITHGGSGDAHRRLGALLGVAMIIQVLLGIFVHWIKVKPHKFRTVSDRGPSNFIHMFIGVIIMLIGWATVWEGVDEEWPKYSGTGDLSSSWKIVWGVFVGVFALTYILGLIFGLPKQLRREAKERIGNTPVALRWVNSNQNQNQNQNRNQNQPMSPMRPLNPPYEMRPRDPSARDEHVPLTPGLGRGQEEEYTDVDYTPKDPNYRSGA